MNFNMKLENMIKKMNLLLDSNPSEKDLLQAKKIFDDIQKINLEKSNYAKNNVVFDYSSLFTAISYLVTLKEGRVYVLRDIERSKIKKESEKKNYHDFYDYNIFRCLVDAKEYYQQEIVNMLGYKTNNLSEYKNCIIVNQYNFNIFQAEEFATHGPHSESDVYPIITFQFLLDKYNIKPDYNSKGLYTEDGRFNKWRNMELANISP